MTLLAAATAAASAAQEAEEDEERRRRDAWLHGRLREMDNRERAVLREAAALLRTLAES